MSPGSARFVVGSILTSPHDGLTDVESLSPQFMTA
jgi:hypothetical protein